MPTGRRVAAVVVTCEHAAAHLPAGVDLGLPPAVMRSHRAWDPGAGAVAKVLARALSAPCFLGSWSRLFVDLNRSSTLPAVIPARVDGRPVPGNVLTARERARRLQLWWTPWRRAAAAAVARAGRAAGGVVHLSVHSFVERLRGIERTNDVGLLYDHRRPRERAFALALRHVLVRQGLRVRCNFPYYGHTDGHTTALRRRLPAHRYLGIEIELNQRRSRSAAGQRALASALIAALHEVIASGVDAR